ncbi:MAG: hypothetical protein KC983_12825 [Phycisphaerales bacterium]|nr:hypothetical protein [Phycisphaerales bacterium]
MTSATIVRERASDGGWGFTLRVDDAATPHLHEATLSWADYNFWSPSGGDAPSAVMLAVVRFLLSRSAADDLPEHFDASLVRRLHRDADVVIPGLITAEG